VKNQVILGKAVCKQSGDSYIESTILRLLQLPYNASVVDFLHLNTPLPRPCFLLGVGLELRARVGSYVVMKESGACILDRRGIEFVNSGQSENVKKVFPVPMGHMFPSLGIIHTLN